MDIAKLTTATVFEALSMPNSDVGGVQTAMIFAILILLPIIVYSYFLKLFQKDLKNPSVSVVNKFKYFKLHSLTYYPIICCFMLLVICLYRVGIYIFLTTNMLLISTITLSISLYIIIFLDSISPKAMFCPFCNQAIFLYSGWQCPNCGELHKSRLLTDNCVTCNTTLTVIDCPRCATEIEFSKSYKGQ
ncbi:MAG: hypothetical protein WC001_05350 [Desulfurivibrionaceae bacterium]